MPYRADQANNNPSSDELRDRIPGWGVDLDPSDRPSYPKQIDALGRTGAHWNFPDRQRETEPRERSIEHEMLTPVFGTSAPLRGLSGTIRRFAYARYSEGRAAHWLLLLGADRVDAIESHLRSFVTLHPDNPLTETGIISEITHHGLASRWSKNRADVKHAWLDPVIVAGPWVLAAVLTVRLFRRRK